MSQSPTLNQGLLRQILLANALFSGLSGLALFIIPGAIGQFMGVSAKPLLMAVGLGLLLFAADLLHQTRSTRMATWRVLYTSTADFAWVLGSLMWVIFWPHSVSENGLMALSWIALLVGTLGFLQIRGINRLYQAVAPQFYRHCLTVEIPVSATAIWEIIGDLGNIQHYMPSLKHSELLNGAKPGVGAVRHCINQNNQAWSEICTAFEPGKSFHMRFLSEEPGFPFPAKEMYGGWAVIPMGSDLTQSQVRVWWELKPKQGWLAPLLMPALAFQADRDFLRLIQSMAEQVSRANANQPTQKAVKARLLPHLC